MRKFGNAERPHNKALRVAGSLRMQLADIEIYWKTWSIPAAGGCMFGSQLTRCSLDSDRRRTTMAERTANGARGEDIEERLSTARARNGLEISELAVISA